MWHRWILKLKSDIYLMLHFLLKILKYKKNKLFTTMFKSMPTNYRSLYRHFPPLYKRDQTYFLDKSHLDFFLIWTRKKNKKTLKQYKNIHKLRRTTSWWLELTVSPCKVWQWWLQHCTEYKLTESWGTTSRQVRLQTQHVEIPRLYIYWTTFTLSIQSIPHTVMHKSFDFV